MCGITGFLAASRRFPHATANNVLSAMSGALRHRGPDAAGGWLDPDAGIALGHRRLSIIDLSENGAQPMVSHSGRLVISFNGEIYNFRELRRDLEAQVSGCGWRGHSDTEVLIEAIDHWGLAETLPRLNGMFAFAVWDRERRELSLARDAFGEKPIYYGWTLTAFLFGSELKALRRFPDFDPAVDQEALAGLLRYAVVPHPRTIHEGFRKLPPGSWLTIDARVQRGELPAPQAYWSIEAAIERARALPFKGEEEEAAARLAEILRKSVVCRMVSDVPLGAFLSGGVDSSIIVALMQEQSSRKVRTFSIGNTESGYDEAGDAEAVAKHLGTDHTALHVDSREARAVVPLLPALYDEPFADSSQIPTYLVARLARADVTVVLSGDAGDELFGGYNRYFHAPAIWRNVGRLPLSVRQGIAGALRLLSPERWDHVASSLSFAFPSELRRGPAGEKISQARRCARRQGRDAFPSKSAVTLDRSRTSLALTGGGLIVARRPSSAELPADLRRTGDVSRYALLSKRRYSG